MPGPSFLRLFTPDGVASSPNAATTWEASLPAGTLSEFYERWMAPKLLARGRDPRTLSEYRDSLSLWEPATGAPSVAQITEAHAEAFLAALRRRRWRGKLLSENTLRKHATNVQAVLDRLLSPSRRHPFGAALRQDVPILERPRPTAKDVDATAITRPELSRLWSAVPAVLGGSGRARCVWAWRAFLTLAAVTGFRLEALRKVESSWLADDDLAREFGGRWLVVPSPASKTDRSYRAFLPRWTGPLVERLARTRGTWFAAVCRSRQQYFTDFRRLAKGAELRPGAAGVHAIRKLVGSELGALNPSAAAMQLGHARGGDVTLHHYTGRRVQVQWVDRREMWPAPDAGE